MSLDPQRKATIGGYPDIQQAVQQFMRIRDGGFRGYASMTNSGVETSVGLGHRRTPQGSREKFDTALTSSSSSCIGQLKYSLSLVRSHQVHAVGGGLIVGSTFGPPPLQEQFKWGADVVMMGSSRFLVTLRQCTAINITGYSSHRVPWRPLRFTGRCIGEDR